MDLNSSTSGIKIKFQLLQISCFTKRATLWNFTFGQLPIIFILRIKLRSRFAIKTQNITFLTKIFFSGDGYFHGSWTKFINE